MALYVSTITMCGICKFGEISARIEGRCGSRKMLRGPFWKHKIEAIRRLFLVHSFKTVVRVHPSVLAKHCHKEHFFR